MTKHRYRRVFKTPLRNTEAEADDDACKLVAVLMEHAPELLPDDLEPLHMPTETMPKKPKSGGREVPGAAAMRKKAIA